MEKGNAVRVVFSPNSVAAPATVSGERPLQSATETRFSRLGKAEEARKSCEPGNLPVTSSIRPRGARAERSSRRGDTTCVAGLCARPAGGVVETGSSVSSQIHTRDKRELLSIPSGIAMEKRYETSQSCIRLPFDVQRRDRGIRR